MAGFIWEVDSMKLARGFFGVVILLAFLGASSPALALKPATVDQPTLGLEVERPFSWEPAYPFLTFSMKKNSPFS